MQNKSWYWNTCAEQQNIPSWDEGLEGSLLLRTTESWGFIADVQSKKHCYAYRRADQLCYQDFILMLNQTLSNPQRD